MRTTLIPQLETSFGKKIASSVCDLASQAQDCSLYIQREFNKIRKVEGRFGLFVPYEEIDSYLIAQFIYAQIDHLSREHRRDIKISITEKVVGKTLSFESFDLCFEKDGVFFLNHDLLKKSKKAYPKGFDWMDFWLHGDDAFGLVSSKPVKIENKKISEVHRVNKIPICLRSIYPIPLTAIDKKIKMATTRSCSST